MAKSQDNPYESAVLWGLPTAQEVTIFNNNVSFSGRTNAKIKTVTQKWVCKCLL